MLTDSGRNLDNFSGVESIGWYCLRSQSKHERIAAVNLRKRAKVEVFAPMMRYQRTQRLGGKTWVSEAMFPGYLFARFEFWLRSREIRGTHGVSGIVQFGGHSPMVPDRFMRELHAFIGPGETAVIPQMLKPGQEVLITNGAFRDLRALITQYYPAKERVRVLIEMLGRSLEVDLSVSVVSTGKPAHPLVRP